MTDTDIRTEIKQWIKIDIREEQKNMEKARIYEQLMIKLVMKYLKNVAFT